MNAHNTCDEEGNLNEPSGRNGHLFTMTATHRSPSQILSMMINIGGDLAIRLRFLQQKEGVATGLSPRSCNTHSIPNATLLFPTLVDNIPCRLEGVMVKSSQILMLFLS